VTTASYRGRFAPSPTGDLHLGSAAAALVAWLRARQAGGALVVRIEDIDRPRIVPGSEGRQLDDLRWLGIDWDEGPNTGGPHAPYRQSERDAHYEAALEALAARGLLFRCDCSRAEIALAASAPHAGDDGPRYPGTCRALGMQPRAWKRPPAIRLAAPPGSVSIADVFQGPYGHDVAAAAGDFVLRRGDGLWAYQLACVVDDLAMGMTEVVRGADLLASAPRQVLLARLLGGDAPGFAHLPLIVADDGARLAKRGGSATLRAHREAGTHPQVLLGWLAAALGLRPTAEAVSAADLRAGADLDALRGRVSAALPSVPSLRP